MVCGFRLCRCSWELELSFQIEPAMLPFERPGRENRKREAEFTWGLQADRTIKIPIVHRDQRTQYTYGVTLRSISVRMSPCTASPLSYLNTKTLLLESASLPGIRYAVGPTS